MLVNHHTHTTYSDGRDRLVDVLAKAHRLGMDGIGISDHAPIRGNPVSHFDAADLDAYLAEIAAAKAMYAGRMHVYAALEVDYIPGSISPVSPQVPRAALDYVLGAVHYVDTWPDGQSFGFEASEEGFVEGVDLIFGGDFRAVIERYYGLIRGMVRTAAPDIVAHLDRIRRHNRGGVYFDESSTWYRDEVRDTLETIARAGILMEVNTKGIYRGETREPYPGRWALRQAFHLGIPVHLGSDAHDKDDLVGGFEEAAAILSEVGYRSTCVRDGEVWREVGIGELVTG